MKRFLVTALMSLMTLGAMAQEAEFTADRPGASTGPSVVGHKVFQLEQGMQYDGDGGKGQFTFSNTLLRYGILEGAELRLGGDALMYHSLGQWHTAFTGLTLGTKIRCYEGAGAMPAVSVLADLAIPSTGSRGFAAEGFTPSLYLLFENPINESLSVGYNVGVESLFSYPTTFLAVCLGFTIDEHLGCFAESYSYLGKYGNLYAVDFGANYMLSERVQLDIAANLDLQHPAQSWAISFGVAWQIN